jgi:hypothetical protein
VNKLGADLTARQAYELLVPTLVDTGYEGICEPLVDFLTVALVKPSATVDAPLTLQDRVGLEGYVPSPAVVSHRRQHLLYLDLPALLPQLSGKTSSDPALLDVARGVQDMVAEARLDRNDRTDAREMARRPQTVRERLGEALTDRILLICRLPNDEDFPPIYHEWAARPRGVSERYTLQHSVDAAAATLDVPSFEVTPTQVMAFKKIHYSGSSYFDIGSGLLPFSITPSDATSTQARAMLAADRVRADAFDLGGDPESGAVAPGEVARLRNLSGHTPQTWNEALSQLLGMQALMGAILGHLHPVVTAYGQFLRRYRRMLTRLEFEIDHAHGRRLGPAIMTFHVQLAWRNWMVLQLDTGETDAITPPDFGVGLTMLETQNNLMWLPSVTSVSLLLSLSLAQLPVTARAPVTAPAPAGNRAPNAAAAPPAVARRDQGRDQGRPIRNTTHPPVYTGNTSFSQNIRSRRVA